MRILAFICLLILSGLTGLYLSLIHISWQYGIAGQVQTAEPVERSFFITK